jgi:hypothetical protein
MASETREEMRSTLRFGWPNGVKGDALRESKALINHQLWGIVGRLHRKSESLNWMTPSLTWRGVLDRIADDRIGSSLSLAERVEDAERHLLSHLLDSSIGDTEPESFSSKIPASGGWFAALPIAEQALDWVLDSNDGPATRVVLAICSYLNFGGDSEGE